MRQSVAPNRASQAPNAATISKLIEKKKEIEAVDALDKICTLFLQRIENMADDFDVMANGGEVFGQVLEQWPTMFQILGHFLKIKTEQEEQAGDVAQETVLERDMLVRIPIDDLQETRTADA